MTTDVPRWLLERHFGNDLRMISAMEETIQGSSSAVAATDALQDATVIVLSANGAFTNERVLDLGEGLEIDITAETVKISVKDVARTREYGATFIPPANVELFLPPEGTLTSNESPANLLNKTLTTPLIDGLVNAANDAAAAAAGVPVKGLYRNGSVLMVRVT